jgi:hypothetical protein
MTLAHNCATDRPTCVVQLERIENHAAPGPGGNQAIGFAAHFTHNA